ncbi:VRR-NUC domain-containing protein [bacterium]|nr:VRR-NUC domain-containing protein [bacterium]
MALESSVEKWVDFYAKERGGRAFKLTGYTGIPDRLVLLPNGITIFVETKRPDGGIISKAQRMVHRSLRGLGFRVFVPCTKHEVQQMFKEL